MTSSNDLLFSLMTSQPALNLYGFRLECVMFRLKTDVTGSFLSVSKPVAAPSHSIPCPFAWQPFRRPAAAALCFLLVEF